MATLTPSSRTTHHASTVPVHPILGDRVIYGQGTSIKTWQTWSPLYNLPPLQVAQEFAPDTRVCIFAPHPDDEILGCGGLLQQLVHNGNEIVLISVTNGTQSHPNSAQYSPEALNHCRPQETQNALNVLGIEKAVTHQLLNLPDGHLYQNQTLLLDKLAEIIQPKDKLVTVFKHDGHPDHEVTGQVVSTFASEHNLSCYQVLIWAWHWASPADERIDWQRLVRLNLTDEQLRKKRQALACFTSQILPDPSTGAEAVLSNEAIERILQIGEVFLTQ